MAEGIRILYPNEAETIDLYYEIVKMANDAKNDLLLSPYAKIIVDASTV